MLQVQIFVLVVCAYTAVFMLNAVQCHNTLYTAMWPYVIIYAAAEIKGRKHTNKILHTFTTGQSSCSKGSECAIICETIPICLSLLHCLQVSWQPLSSPAPAQWLCHCPGRVTEVLKFFTSCDIILCFCMKFHDTPTSHAATPPEHPVTPGQPMPQTGPVVGTDGKRIDYQLYISIHSIIPHSHGQLTKAEPNFIARYSTCLYVHVKRHNVMLYMMHRYRIAIESCPRYLHLLLIFTHGMNAFYPNCFLHMYVRSAFKVPLTRSCFSVLNEAITLVTRH